LTEKVVELELDPAFHEGNAGQGLIHGRITGWYLAGWYVMETGLDNSVALVPLDGKQSDFAIVNWARWDVSPLRHFWTQLFKQSFWRYVTANLEANRAGSMPIYYRLA
jgi:hypothetical protein